MNVGVNIIAELMRGQLVYGQEILHGGLPGTFVCVAHCIITKGLLGKRTVHWGTREVCEHSGIFIALIVN